MPAIFFKALFMALLLGASISTQSWLRCNWGIKFTVTIFYGFGRALPALGYMVQVKAAAFSKILTCLRIY
jgi:hypothetical protein